MEPTDRQPRSTIPIGTTVSPTIALDRKQHPRTVPIPIGTLGVVVAHTNGGAPGLGYNIVAFPKPLRDDQGAIWPVHPRDFGDEDRTHIRILYSDDELTVECEA